MPWSAATFSSAVRAGGGVERHEPGEDERGGQPRAPDLAGGPGGGGSGGPGGSRVHQIADHQQLERGGEPARAVHQVGAYGDDGAHGQRGDRGLADADEDVYADHGGQHLADRHVRRAADGVDQREGGGRGGHGHQGGDERGGGERAAPARQDLHEAAEERVRDDDRDHTHDGDVHAERGEAAVREEDALHQQDDRDAEHPRERTDQYRGERTAEQVTAGTGRDREVQHLYGEDERGDESRERGRPLFPEFTARSSQADGDGGHGCDARHSRNRCADESVGDMHREAPLPAGWLTVR